MDSLAKKLAQLAMPMSVTVTQVQAVTVSNSSSLWVLLAEVLCHEVIECSSKLHARWPSPYDHKVQDLAPVLLAGAWQSCQLEGLLDPLAQTNGVAHLYYKEGEKVSE